MRTPLNLDEDAAARLAAASRTANELLRVLRRIGAYEPPVFDSGRPRLDVTDVAAALESPHGAG